MHCAIIIVIISVFICTCFIL